VSSVPLRHDARDAVGTNAGYYELAGADEIRAYFAHVMQFAMLGVVEAIVKSDEEKNRLCPSIAYWDTNTHYLSAFLAGLAHERARFAYPALASWAKETRPNVLDAFERIERFRGAAATNLVRLLSPSDSASER
jgi:hypothetical protein